VIIGSSRYNSNTSLLKRFCECLGVFNNLTAIESELWPKRFSKRHRLGGNSMLMWTSLYPRKYSTSYEFLMFRFCHYHSAPWSSEGFMCRGSYNITVWNRVFENSSSYKTSNVRNICHKNRSNFFCNF